MRRLVGWAGVGASSSRYAEPDAGGVIPVLRSLRGVRLGYLGRFYIVVCHSQTLRSSSGALVRSGRSGFPMAGFVIQENSRGLVPLGGPLFRRLSAMVSAGFELDCKISLFTSKAGRWELFLGEEMGNADWFDEVLAFPGPGQLSARDEAWRLKLYFNLTASFNLQLVSFFILYHLIHLQFFVHPISISTISEGYLYCFSNC
jgi:hypothetical protein